MSRQVSKYVAVLLLALLLVPTVNAFTIDGPTNFQYGTDGNVRFGDTFVSTQLSIVNALNQFNSLRYGGANWGALAFSCDTGVNMTILSVTRHTIRYNVSTLIGGGVDTYVHYNRNDEIPTGVNTDNIVYDPVTDIATVTTTGNGVIVTLNYVTSISTTLTDNGEILVSIFLVVALILVFMSLGGMIDTKTLITFLIVITLVMAFSAIFRSWGY